MIMGFGELRPNLLSELESISFPMQFAAGSILFAEGEQPRGVFHILDGQAKLSICSGDGKTFILRVAKAADVLGIPGALSGREYEVTAETLTPVRLAFIKRQSFLRFMKAHQEVCLAVAYQLTTMYNLACHEIRCLGLGHTANEKLAQLLLQWPLSPGDRPSRIRFDFRHEDVAQMIGTSRETVSRVFADLKKKGIAELDSSTLHIRNRAVLKEMASGIMYEAGAPSASPETTAAEEAEPERRTSRLEESCFHPDGV